MLENSLEQMRESWINEPTYFFKVGDRVQHGAIKKSIVIEILDNGKIYKLHENFKHRQGYKLINCERDFYVEWMNIRPYVDKVPPKKESFAYESDAYRRISYYQQDISSLLNSNYDYWAGIDCEPEYQRGLVWDLCDKVALIDSIFKKIDIGKFTLIKREYAPNQKGSEMLDGKQRLNAIVEFYEDRFEYRGKTFSELHPYDKRYFRKYPISIGDTNAMTEKEKYEYFLRLNVGGKTQDPEHIKHVENLIKEYHNVK